MAKLISIYWRDIPAQVVGRAGRRGGAKKELAPRFAKAIDRAAMKRSTFRDIGSPSSSRLRALYQVMFIS